MAARLLGVEDRGYLAILMIFTAVLWQLGTLGMPFAIPYFINSSKTSGWRFAHGLRPVLTTQLAVLSAIHVAIIVVFSLNVEPDVRLAAWLTLTVLPGLITLQYGLAILQGLHEYFRFNLFRMSPLLLYAGVLACLLVLDVRNLAAVAMSWSGAYLLVGAATVFMGFRALKAHNLSLDGPPPKVKDMVVFGSKALLGSVPPVESFRLDQALVAVFLSPVSLGLYVVAFGFTNLPGFIAKSVGSVAYPHIASRQGEQTSQSRSIWRFFWVTTGLAIPVAVGIGLVAPFLVPLLFGDEFTRSVPLVWVLLGEGVFSSGRRVLSDGLKGAGSPLSGTIAELSYLGALIITAPLLLQQGILGFSFAMVASAGCSLAVMIVLVYRYSGTAKRKHADPTPVPTDVP